MSQGWTQLHTDTARFGLAAAALFLASCGGEAPTRVEAQQAAPVPARTVVVAARDWPDVYEATGAVHASTSAAISSKVMGYIRDVRVHAGDHVREGQLLVTIDARDLEANLRRAEAARAEVTSAIPEAENAIVAARANLDLADATYRRMEDLNSKQSISRQEFDEASARRKSAQANFEMARSRRAQLDSKAAQVEQEIRAATITRDYATIAAPFDGIVTARAAEPGMLAAPGAPLVTIERAGAYRLEAGVEESRIAAIRVGQPVEVSLDALGRKIAARVSEMVPAVDPGSRAYTVKIDLPATADLRTGMFGRASFALGARSVVAVPAAAVSERGQIASVFVAENGAARNRLVTLGRRTGDAVEILSGVGAGERVVAPIPAGLVDGARLEVRQ